MGATIGAIIAAVVVHMGIFCLDGTMSAVVVQMVICSAGKGTPFCGEG
eukprot:CAMPEP_0197942210 /NCGR_PEP_ID=MMETSP1439-20131203/124006_1 /TAXON_ID=66791 /ORGANISM="Gonyaulax spinifera, Strain CCMP409" /LENGTH=47 /DNA_ID= /DNA_START= /DNA_END= /DNA_ORIENTATION=